MPKRRARWSQVIRGLIGVAAVVLALAIVWALLVPGTDWLARHDMSSAKGALTTARDAARGRLLTLGAGLLAAGALLFTARNFTLSREGQVTDRYTKAVEQLGSKELDVRIGGVYALERIARDSAKDHPTVMEVLTAFIRMHSREPWSPPDPGSPAQERSIRPDVQAAVTVVRRRDAKRDIQPIDLAGADLTGVTLTGADLPRADLTGANLTGANLTDADLHHATLHHADLTGADLTDADLTGANLPRAVLTDATLPRADLPRADLTNADLTNAVLHHANLTDAVLDGANLDGANLASANLAGAHFDGADLTNATLTLAVLAGAVLPQANLTGAYLPQADLTGAELGGANLYRAELTRVDLTDVRWPEEKPVPEGWTVDSTSGRLKSADGLSELMPHYL
jgi:uncharacterized protein YjbI with pentapeptide repeats